MTRGSKCSRCGGPRGERSTAGYCRRCASNYERERRARVRREHDELVAAARAVTIHTNQAGLARLRRAVAPFLVLLVLWTGLWIKGATGNIAAAEQMPPIDYGAASASARRLGRWQETPLPAPPTTIVLDACAEMNHWRIVYGLPDRFSDQPRQPAVSFGRQGLGWRESNCSNTAISGTGCCVGYWQLHSVIFRDHRMVDRLAACGATWQNVRGTSTESKRRQACAARVLYDVAGLQPWAL